MFGRLLAIGTAITAAVVAAQPAAAQQGFEPGYVDVGPVVGLGGISSASIALGGRVERGFREMPEFGNGVLGFMIGAEYYSYSEPGFSWSYIPVGATANYHFRIEDNRQIDPFVGLGLGYQIVSCSWDGVGGLDPCGGSALYFIGRAGARYFLNSRMAVYGDVGAGAATLNFGAMFRLN